MLTASDCTLPLFAMLSQCGGDRIEMDRVKGIATLIEQALGRPFIAGSRIPLLIPPAVKGSWRSVSWPRAITTPLLIRKLIAAAGRMAPEVREEVHAYCLRALIDYEVKLITINVWGMPYVLGGRRSERFSELGMEIAGSGAQVVCLQEMWDRSTRAILDKAQFRHHLGAESMHGIPGGSGLCLLTNFDVEESELLESGATRGFERLVRKGALYARLRQPGGRLLDVYNVHLISSSAVMTERSVEGIRDRQIGELQDWINQRRRPGISIVVMGDLNINDVSPQYHRLQALGDDTFSLCHGEGASRCPTTHGYTFDPTKNPWANSWLSSPQRIPERLDYIFVQPAAMQRLELVSQTIWDTPTSSGHFLSDHFGVTTTMRNIRL